MEPTILVGEDVIIGDGMPEPGSIALIEGGSAYILHRLVRRVRLPWGERWIHRGDAPGGGFGLAAPEQLLGVVVSVGGRGASRAVPLPWWEGPIALATLAREKLWPPGGAQETSPSLPESEEQEELNIVRFRASRSFRRLRVIDRLMLGPAPGRTLEIGCGSGRLLEPLLAGKAAVAGIDHWAQMLRRARRLAIPVARALAEELPLRAESLDTVVAGNGAMHEMDRPRAFAEAARVLRPGGRFAFHVYPAEEIRPDLYQRLRALVGRTVVYGSRIGFRSIDAVEDELRTAGFEPRRVWVLRNVRVPPWVFPLPKRWWGLAAHVVFTARRRPAPPSDRP